MTKPYETYEIDGKELTLSAISKEYDIDAKALRARVASGMSIVDAVHTPLAIDSNRETREIIAKAGADMTLSMLKTVFTKNRKQFEAWVEDQMASNMTKFMSDILPKYLKLYEMTNTNEGSPKELPQLAIQINNVSGVK